MTSTQTLPKWMWHKKFECVVEILRSGHFPTTVMVKLPDDKEIETDVVNLISDGAAK